MVEIAVVEMIIGVTVGSDSIKKPDIEPLVVLISDSLSLLKVSSISDDDGTKSVKVGAVVVEVSNVELIIPVVDGQRVWLAPEYGSVLT